MRANEFEKNVHQKMNELELSPHEEVWQEVERRIRKEKKRRGTFFWLILVGLLLGGATVTLFSLNKKNKSDVIVASKKDPGNDRDTKPTINSPVENKPGTIPPGKEITPKNEETNLPETPAGKRTETTTNAKKTGQKGKNESQVSIPTKLKQVKQKHKGNRMEPITPAVKDEHVSIQKKDTMPTVEPVITGNDFLIQNNNKIPDTSAKHIDTGIRKDEKQEDLTAPVKEPVDTTTVISKSNDKKEKKREWGFIVQGGISNNVKGLHFFESRVYASALAVTGSSSGLSSREPALLRPGVSFSAGVYTAQPLSAKLRLNADLTYAYLSTRMRVGSRIDTSAMSTNPNSLDLQISRFYRSSGNLSPISNRFHFLSLETQLSWRIIDRDKFTLFWDNGVSYKWLFASRVFHYDWGFRGYYEDPRLLTHHHVFISTGLSFPVSRRTTIHPFAEYSLTRVMRHNRDSLRTHFTNYGVRLKISMGNRK